MNKKYLNQNKFMDLFNAIDESEEIKPVECRAYEILATIVDYMDCLGSFINSITLEEVDKAMDLINEDYTLKIHSLNKTESAIELLSGAKNTKKALAEDLF